MNGVVFQRESSKEKKDSQINQDIKKLDNLVEKSEKVILKVRAAFPFVFFPDELIIDANKVTVRKYYFFKSAQVVSFSYEDIANVIVESTPFLAKLIIFDKNSPQTSISVDDLKRQIAVKARRIIRGIMISRTEKVDIARIPTVELAQKLEKLGKSSEIK